MEMTTFVSKFENGDRTISCTAALYVHLAWQDPKCWTYTMHVQYLYCQCLDLYLFIPSLVIKQRCLYL